eukprot:TRINITY_DN33119_c0_g1_i1.p1 TRINITY_DN33119_c0_g1~~TRINITY_DN33119_c0_g1_i1.p1  ORF type:complete len:367 (+),score=98.36 TRINITY_DN33119_c0_g1_i1:134-1234(+)
MGDVAVAAGSKSPKGALKLQSTAAKKQPRLTQEQWAVVLKKQAERDKIKAEEDRQKKLDAIEKQARISSRLPGKILHTRSELTLERKKETVEARTAFLKATDVRVKAWEKKTANTPLAQTDISWAMDAYGERKPSRSFLERQEAKQRRMVHNAILYAGISEPDDYMRSLIMEKRGLCETRKATKAKIDLEKVNLKLDHVTRNRDKFVAEMNSRPQLQWVTSDYYSNPVLREVPGWQPRTRRNVLLELENKIQEKESSMEAPKDEEEASWRAVEAVFDRHCEEAGLSQHGFERILEQCSIIDGVSSGVFTRGHSTVIWANTSVAGRRKFIDFEAFKEAVRRLAQWFDCDIERVRDVISGRGPDATQA